MIYEYNGSNLVDGLYFIYASWNSKCNILIDRINRINKEFPNINIYKVNITKYPTIKAKFLVKKIPSYIFVKDNEIFARKDGNIDYFTLKNWLLEKV